MNVVPRHETGKVINLVGHSTDNEIQNSCFLKNALNRIETIFRQSLKNFYYCT